LVGRIELITPAENASLVSTLNANAESATAMNPTVLGRFAEPRIRHALTTLTAPKAIAYATELLGRAHALP
jgi:hypothetical protein